MKWALTDERFKNKKFRTTEKAITEAIYSSKGVLNARVIIKRAKISRITLYRHHKTVYNVVPDYEVYLLKKYCSLMRRLLNYQNINLKTTYYQMLIFILRNKDVFKLIISKSDGHLIGTMVSKIEPKIIEIYKLPKNNQKILKIFEKEIEGLLTDWAKSNFKEDVVEVLNNILYLTNTMRKRLLPLEGLN